MSTLPKRKLVFRRAWALSGSKSSSYSAPARAKMSPSPVQSLPALARRPLRPSLLSKTTPVTRPPSLTAATAQQWRSVCTPASRTTALGGGVATSGRAEEGVRVAASLGQLLAEAGDDEVALPVRHAVDPGDEAAGGEAAQVAVTLEEDDAGALARRG